MNLYVLCATPPYEPGSQEEGTLQASAPAAALVVGSSCCRPAALPPGVGAGAGEGALITVYPPGPFSFLPAAPVLLF